MEKRDHILTGLERAGLEKCPKCGYGETGDESCTRCGLIFEKYFEVKRRKATGDRPFDRPCIGVNRRGIRGFRPAAWGIVTILFLGILTGASNPTTGSIDAYEPAPGMAGRAERQDVLLRKGKAFFGKGIVAGGRRDMVGAALKFERALRHFERLDDKKLMAPTLLNLAVCYRILGRYQDALASFEKAAEISREEGLQRCEVGTLRQAGLLYSDMGQYDLSLSCLEEALSLHEALDDKRAVIWDNIMLGVIEGRKPSREAGKYFERALAALREIDDPLLARKTVRILQSWRNGHSGKIRFLNDPPALETLSFL